jgi:hypothetical protein
MRLNKVCILIFALAVLAAGCGKDNYDEPSSMLMGKVIYNGQAIGVKGTGSAVQLELWQDGYDLYTSIPVYLTQDGSFSAVLFDGTYKLVSKSGNGPWVSAQDTVVVTVKGSTTVDYTVTPFYTISNESFSLSGNTLTATFDISQIAGAQAVERAILVVNKTNFVDETAQIQRVDLTDPGTGQVTMTMTLSDDVLSNSTLNARVGVKISGREAIYSSVQNIIK